VKFYGSIAVGICMIWLRFEPDLDQSQSVDQHLFWICGLDPGSVVFKIARRIVLKVMDGFH